MISRYFIIQLTIILHHHVSRYDHVLNRQYDVS